MKRKCKILAAAALALLGLAAPVQAQTTLASYEFNNDGTGTDLSATTVAAGVTADDASSGGQGANGFDIFTNNSLTVLFTSQGVGLDGSTTSDTAGIDTAFARNEYFSFNLSASGGGLLDFTSMTFDISKGTNGANSYFVRSSADGYTANLAQAFNGIPATGVVVDLTSIADTSSAEFRVYVHGRNNNSSGSATRLDNVTFAGTAIAGDDTDGDGLEDAWELAQTGVTDLADLDGTIATTTGSGSGSGDFDGDMLVDADEFTAGTDAGDPDSDDDTLLDGVETNTGTFVSSVDTGSDPLDDDSDNDTLNDGDEVNIARLSGPMDPQQAGTNGGFGGGSGNGSGLIVGTFHTTQNLLDYTLTWQDLLGTVNNMHFHLGAPGVSGGVELAVSGPWASPQVGSNISVTGTKKTNLLNGDWYLNIHTTSFGGGEIRGQVLVGFSDPNETDSDGDGLDDDVEVANAAAGYNPGIDDGLSDFDEDGSVLSDELANGTGHLDPDSDNDGLLDGVETNVGSWASSTDTGTDPLNPDSDGDGFLDGDENNSGTYVSQSDPGTDPNLADTDGDGFRDGDEGTYGGDPTVFESSLPNAVNGYATSGGDWLTSHAAFDIDGDGSLGTDGFFFFGDFSGGSDNGQPFSTNVSILPSYVSSIDPGADALTVSFGPAQGQIDSPLLLDGTDEGGGMIIAVGGSVGAVTELMTFAVTGLAEGQVVRVGVLGGGAPQTDGRWDPISLILEGPGGYQKAGLNLPLNPGGVNTGWLFFDIDTDGTYSVSGAQRLATQGSSVNGLTFDSIGGVAGDLTLAVESVGANLEFTWNKDSGKTYGIRRTTDLSLAPATWSTWQSSIDGSVPGPETFPRPADGASYFQLFEE